MEVVNQKSSRESGRNRGNSSVHRNDFDNEQRVRSFDPRAGGNSGNFMHSVFAMLDEDDDFLLDE